jgi:nucleotide-binding universal stress UspA family protein
MCVEAPHYATVLVPLDGSYLAAEALPRAVEVAKANAATVVLLHVMDPGDVTIERRARRWQMESYLDGLKRSLARGGVKVAWLIEAGSPAETIAGVAATLMSPLIVLSHAGHSAASGAVEGGRVARDLSRIWSGPTLIV